MKRTFQNVGPAVPNILPAVHSMTYKALIQCHIHSFWLCPVIKTHCSQVGSFASSRRHVMTMYMISDSSVFLQYECIYILLAYMYTLPCSICMLSLFLLLSDNSCDQLMLFVLLYPTQNKSYVMLCYDNIYLGQHWLMLRLWAALVKYKFPNSMSII